MKSLGVCVIMLAACVPSEAPPRATSSRVVALVPAATEIIGALGASHMLIGRAEEDSARAIAHLPAAGRVLSPSTERIIELQPDLVIAWPGAGTMLEYMRSVGVRTFAARFERVDDVMTNTRAIGELLGVNHRADSLAESIRSQLQQLRSRHANDVRPSVLYLLDSDPYWTAGATTFVNDLIQIAGGTNAFADLPAPWSEVSLEAIIAREPDVLIVAQPPHKQSREWLAQRGWRELRAVRQNRVHFVDADVFNRPGPNVVESARQLARLLHPDSYQ